MPATDTGHADYLFDVANAHRLTYLNGLNRFARSPNAASTAYAGLWVGVTILAESLKEFC